MSSNVLKTYYDDFGVTNNSKANLKNEELFNLYSIPKRDKGLNESHFQNYKPGIIHQADLLFLPDDKGYKYALVVVDIGSRYVATIPLKNKTSLDIVKAFKDIYSSNVLKKPEYIEVDSGGEFKGETATYFKDNNIHVRYGKPGRHKQQALVERTNQIIGTALHKRMTAQELLTGVPATEWVDDILNIVNAMNRKAKNRKQPTVYTIPVCEGDSCNLLESGTKVRVKLEEPIDVATGKRLHGKFRSSDIRWNPEHRKVKNILLRPGFPPQYLLDGKNGPRKVEPIAYTKNELQIIPPYENPPDGHKVIRGKPETYIIDKIVDDKNIKNKKYYLIRWKGFKPSDDTWELATNIKNDVPQLVDDYENGIKPITLSKSKSK